MYLLKFQSIEMILILSILIVGGIFALAEQKGGLFITSKRIFITSPSIILDWTEVVSVEDDEKYLVVKTRAETLRVKLSRLQKEQRLLACDITRRYFEAVSELGIQIVSEPKPELSTVRLKLRPWKRDDAEVSQRIDGDDEISANQLSDSMSESKAQLRFDAELVAAESPGFFYWAICSRSTDEVIGEFRFSRLTGSIDVERLVSICCRNSGGMVIPLKR